jgi:hypothetical protein
MLLVNDSDGGLFGNCRGALRTKLVCTRLYIHVKTM